MPLRIGFFGTPSLAAAVLSDLLSDERFEVVFVVTNPDKPVGRSSKLQSTPVKTLAMSRDIPVLTPTRIRENTEFLDSLRSYQAEYFVVVAYGRILPSELLDIPQMCLNVHGSLLPQYRGASPIQSALLHGEEETGVTIMQMSLGMDEGDIMRQEIIPIEVTETSGTLFEKYAQISGQVLISTLIDLSLGRVEMIPQDESRVSYCKKILKEDGKIDWSESAKIIYQKWQAYTPWPGIFSTLGDKRIIIESCRWSPSETPDLSTIATIDRLSDGQIVVQCGSGYLILDRVRVEGKKSMSISDLVRGQRDIIGSRLGEG